MTRCVKSLALTGASVLGLSCGAAQAQTATPPPGEAANAVAEVVVTAQKREQSINKVPLSVTALTGAQLAEQQVRTGADLARVVPGLTFTQSQFDAPTYTLRGVGFYESSLSANPAVSVYVDEVPLPYPATTRGALLDLERVEVLKGPQGTLFGQNSTGGAINYVAAKPTADLHAGGEVSYGRFDTVNANGYVSGPIAPTLNGRLSLQVDESGPWQQSRTRNAELGDSDVFSGRLLLDWKPTDQLSVTLNLNGWRDASDTQAPQGVGIYPAVSTFPVNPAVLAEPLNPTDDRQADWDPAAAFTRDNGFWQGALH